MARIIMHVDMDAFFAAAEQREHPEWKGKPVVVGADPKQGKGRGVVATASYEARKFGIKSAMPISKAYKLCPTAIFARPNFQLYISASESVMKILRSHSGKFEQVSIDEAFMDLAGKAKGMDEAAKLAAEIKKEILEKEKLGCSIGIASNKLVAKTASDFRKPDGLTIVEPGNEKEFLEPLPVRKLTGVGPKTEAMLGGIGITSIGELAAVPAGLLEKELGKFGVYLHEAANGIDESEVEENYEIKSVSRNLTFEEDTRDKALVLAAIEEMARDACASLKESGLSCRTAGIRIRFEDFETHTKEKTLAEATADSPIVTKTAKQLLQPFFSDKRKIRLVGIRLSHFQQRDQKQRMMQEYVE